MSAITLRDVPLTLHEALKQSADRNRRSLNAEIVFRLEQSVEHVEAVRRVSPEEIRERAARLREETKALGIFLTDEEITAAKNQGRP